MEKIERAAKLLRDVGIILGIPAVLVIGGKLYSAQIQALKEQNELLKQTQYDKALSLIEAQKKLVTHEQYLISESLDAIKRLMENAEECKEHFNDGGADYCDPDVYENDLYAARTTLLELRKFVEGK